MTKVSIRAYARHRRLAHRAVQVAIERGKLDKSVTGKGRQTRIDVELADQEWPNESLDAKAHMSRPNMLRKAMEAPKLESLPAAPKAESKQPESFLPEEKPETPDPERGKYWRSKADKEELAAELLRLKIERDSGKLISLEAVKKEWSTLAQNVRTKLLALPSKMRQRAPGFTHEFYSLLDELLREALIELSEGGENGNQKTAEQMP